MAKTPKPVRREHKKQRSAEFWMNKVKEASSVRPAPKTSTAHANILAAKQEREGGPVPYTYYPTKTSNPADPRTAAAGYDAETGTLHVAWGDGGVSYNYYDVPPNVWRNFRKAPSPGKFINRVLNNYNYGPAGE